MTNPLPTGAVVQVNSPAPPTIAVPSPQGSGVVVMPVPGIPGSLDPEQIEDITDEIEEGLEPPVDLTVLFENGLL